MDTREIFNQAKKKKISDEHLAIAAGVSTMTIYRWRKKKNQPHPHYIPYLKQAVENFK